jgi:hypothetical protein
LKGERLGVVGAEDEAAAGNDVGREAGEGLLHRLPSLVVVEMVGLDVGDHGYLRVVAEEGAVVLVRLDDDVLAGAGRGVGAQVRQLGADQVGRVQPQVLEHEGEHAGRRALAVTARHANARPAGHQPRHHVGALHQGQSATASLEQLRVIAHRGGSRHHELGIAEVRRFVRTDVDTCSQALQRVRERCPAQVRA